MGHAVNLSEFQLVFSGRSSRKSDKENKYSRSDNRKNSNDTRHTYKSEKDNNKKTPVCLWETHRWKGLHHVLKDCPECLVEDTKRLLRILAEESAKYGPSKSTRGQWRVKNDKPNTKPTVNCFQQWVVKVHPLNSCPLIVSDGIVSVSGVGRCDYATTDSALQRLIKKWYGK